jgi:hypothetical protein
MKVLNEYIKTIVIPIVESGMVNCVVDGNAVVVPVLRGNVTNYVKYDDSRKLCNGVFINDGSDIFFAFVLHSQNFEVIQDVGNKKRYNVSANLKMYVFSKIFRGVKDYICSRLSEVKNLTINNVSGHATDSMSIFTNKNISVQHDSFIVDLNIDYKLDSCNVKTIEGGLLCNGY